MKSESSFYHDFVDQELVKKGFTIKLINEDYIATRILDCISFVNGILEEYQNTYNLWTPKPREWFLNPMIRKWEFSLVIEDLKNQIALFNFTSVYGELLHNHCTYVNRNLRGLGLAKLHMLKICQLGLDNGFKKYEGYWDKHNNGSLILHLKMGFMIESFRKNEQLLLVGDLLDIRNKVFNIYEKENSYIIKSDLFDK